MIRYSYFKRAGRRIGRRAIAALDALFEYRDIRRQRRQLAALDERALRDIGLSRADVERECRRPRRLRSTAGYSASVASGVRSAPEGRA